MQRNPYRLLPVQFARLWAINLCRFGVDLLSGICWSKRPACQSRTPTQAVGAERDGYAGASERLEHIICSSLDAGFNEVGAVARAPAVGAIGQRAL